MDLVHQACWVCLRGPAVGHRRPAHRLALAAECDEDVLFRDTGHVSHALIAGVAVQRPRPICQPKMGAA